MSAFSSLACILSYIFLLHLLVGQVTQEQQMAALKTVQTLERHRQNYMFQLQQVELNVQQLQDALAMEEQFQAMKVQQKPPVESGQPIKLALRKRYVHAH